MIICHDFKQVVCPVLSARWWPWLCTVSFWLVWLVDSSSTPPRVTRVTTWTSTCLCSPYCSSSSM